jgi:hypothetical protein
MVDYLNQVIALCDAARELDAEATPRADLVPQPVRPASTPGVAVARARP